MRLNHDLIADLYAAAIDDELWPSFMTLLGKVTGIEAVSVWVTDRGKFVDLSVADAFAPQIATYQQHFGRLDPWAASLARHPPETVMIGYEHMPEDQLVRTEFYNDWARIGGMFRPIGAKMRLAPGVHAIMGSDSPSAKRLMEPADKRRIEAILPFVKGSLQLRRRHQQAGMMTGLTEAALDALSFGVLICDGVGVLVHANTEAERLLRQNAGILLGGRGKAVSATTPDKTRQLRGFIRDAANGGAGGIVRLDGTEPVGPVLALVVPLPRQLAGARRGHVLVALRPVRDRATFTTAMIATAFRLTPTQAAIARALFEGGSPEAIARDRGISISTLRTHLSDIYARTGTETQRDLVRLLGGLPPIG